MDIPFLQVRVCWAAAQESKGNCSEQAGRVEVFMFEERWRSNKGWICEGREGSKSELVESESRYGKGQPTKIGWHGKVVTVELV